MSACSGQAQTRRTRIVCVSDTHNQTPQLPKGDILIHAGDLTNQGSYSELKKTIAWLEKADYESKIVIAGNHDITLDANFYSEHWAYFHNQHKQDSNDCMSLLRDSPSITYLQHQPLHVKLTSPFGPQTHFKAFGSPFSPAHGLWAFGYTEETATTLWDQIPEDTDILITHTPPKGHCDRMVTKNRAGCDHLRRRLWEVRPKLAICGHLHEGRGAENIWWKNDVSDNSCIGESTDYWIDPGAGDGNRKQSLLDLTAKTRSEWTSMPATLPNMRAASQRRRKLNGRVSFSSAQMEPPTEHQIESRKDIYSFRKGLAAHTINYTENVAATKDIDTQSAAYDGETDGKVFLPTEGVEPRTQVNQRTCVVNAAIMANSWGGPKRLNKPIVVDIDLPVWAEEA